MSRTYDESYDRGTELCRLVVPRMLKQDATPNPVSYAVWYEHVAGRNAALSREVDALTADGGRLDDAITHDLHHRYLADADMESAAHVHDALTRVIGETASAISGSESAVAGYLTDLRQRRAALQKPVDRIQLHNVLTDLLAETEKVSSSMAQAGSRLASNRDEIEQLRDELRRAKELALIDALSRLTNRRGFDLELARLTGAADATQEPLALIIIDIDHFKLFNDTHGHVLGDRTIRGVAQAMERSARPSDVVSRYGGEEFAILLPNTGAKDAMGVAERIRGTVARAYVRRVEDAVAVGSVTVSAGVTEYRKGEAATEFVDRADKALYAAKFAGRNRVHQR